MFTANLSRMVLFVFAAVLAVKGAVALRVQGQQTAGDVFEVASVKASPPQQLGGEAFPVVAAHVVVSLRSSPQGLLQRERQLIC